MKPVPMSNPAPGSIEAELLRELVSLRVSVARVAQVLGQLDSRASLKVEELGFSELHKLASTQGRGWNDLCYWMVERARDLCNSEDTLAILESSGDEFDK